MAYHNASGPVRTRRVDPSELTRGGETGRAGGSKPRLARNAASGSRAGASRSGSAGSQPRSLRSSVPPEVFFVDDIEIHLQHKRVKNLNLRIARDGDHVEVSAPAWMTQADVVDFVRRKRDWIETQMARVAATPMARASQASPAEVAQWRAVVQACVPALIAAWEPIMGGEGRLACVSQHDKPLGQLPAVHRTHLHQRAPGALPARVPGIRSGARAVPST